MRAWGVAWATVVFGAIAQGAITEHPVRVGDEDDVFAMEDREELSSDASETLVELMRQGVDLNSASREVLEELPGLDEPDIDRILEHRKSHGPLESRADLLTLGLVTREQLEALSPFLSFGQPGRTALLSGDVRLVTRAMPSDTIAPPVLLGANVRGPFALSGNLWLTTTRREPTSPAWNPAKGALVSDGFGYHLGIPAVALRWHPGRFQVVAGTFALGFAERLTLDNTRRAHPDGLTLVDGVRHATGSSAGCRLSPPQGPGCAESGSVFVTPDFVFRELFRGVAISVEEVPLGGTARFSLHGFASYQTRSLYQYELFDRRACPDPRADTRAQCGAPLVYLPDLSTRVLTSTLPSVFDELAAGGHVSFEPSDRWKLGVTGYGAAPFFHAQPAELDFQEWSRWPNGGAFGAVGLDAAAHPGALGLFLEVARSFDRSTGNEGGGFGAEQRSTWSGHGHALELSLQYYDLHFLNPYARPISAPGEYDGQRARNEAGARLRYSGKLGRLWRLGGRADLWLNPFEEPGRQPAFVTNLRTLARLDFTGSKVVQPGVWLDVRARNLASSARGTCEPYDSAEGGTYTCSTELYRATAHLELIPLERRLRLTAQGSLSWVRDVSDPSRLRNDVVAWAEFDAWPLEALQLRLRARYLFQDLADQRLEQSAWGRFEAVWSPAPSTRIALRYELYALLDQRASSLTRQPNPEHRFALDARLSF